MAEPTRDSSSRAKFDHCRNLVAGGYARRVAHAYAGPGCFHAHGFNGRFRHPVYVSREGSSYRSGRIHGSAKKPTPVFPHFLCQQIAEGIVVACYIGQFSQRIEQSLGESLCRAAFMYAPDRTEDRTYMTFLRGVVSQRFYQKRCFPNASLTYYNRASLSPVIPRE